MKKLRQSNIELLRIISMLLVLMVHADFFSLGIPSHDLMLASPGQFTFRVLVEFLSILCVDIFVVISGWVLHSPFGAWLLQLSLAMPLFLGWNICSDVALWHRVFVPRRHSWYFLS